MPTHRIESILVIEVHGDQRVTVCSSVVRTIAYLLYAWYIFEETVHLSQHIVDNLTPDFRLDSQDYLMPNHLSSLAAST